MKVVDRDPALRVTLLEQQVKTWRDRAREFERKLKEANERIAELSALLREREAREQLSRAGAKRQQLRRGAEITGAALTLSRDRVKAAWGAAAPDWVMALAKACDETSQSKVASALGCSAATINQTLGKRYVGRMDRLEARFWGWYDTREPAQELAKTA